MTPGRRRLARLVLASALVVAPIACVDQDMTVRAVKAMVTPPRPDTFPRLLNAELPFRYPSALYAQRVQGNVTLRIFIDSTGRVWPESTLVAESSGHPLLDSAAVQGSDALRFTPAKLGPDPMNVRVSFPVFFRHPNGEKLPGDSVLRDSA